MKKKSGYIVLAVAASIYIFYNFIVTSFIVAQRSDETFSLWKVFLAEVIVFVPVGVFFIVAQKLYKKKRWLFTTFSVKTVIIHLLLLVSLIVIHSVWQVYFNSIFIGANFVTATVVKDIIGFLNLRVLIYIISIGLIVGIVKIQEKEKSLLKQSELKLKLQKTSFKELELKLNPEIIYPNLDFIKKNVHAKPEQTSELVLNLSKQLRILIDSIDEERIPVKRDLLFFKYYFQTVQLRLDREIAIREEVKKEHLEVKIPSLVLIVPFLEELLFGKYTDFTQTVDCVTYKSRKTEPGFILLALHFQPVENAKKLQMKLKTEKKIAEIHKLIAGYEGSFFKYDVMDNCLSLTLKMETE